MQFFETEEELRDYIHKLLKRFGMEQNKIKEISQKGFDSGLFHTERRTVHHLTIDRSNESRFFNSLSFLDSENSMLSVEERNIQNRQVEKEDYRGFRYSNPKDMVSTVSKEIDEFDRTFFDLLERVIEGFEKAKIIDGVLDTYPSSDGKEPIHLKAAKESLLQLLDIFYEIINVYTLRSTILWPQKINDKNILYKLNSIVFNKITDMHKVLHQALGSFHSGKFNSDFVNYLAGSLYAARAFSKYYNTFKSSGLQRESEPLMDSIWSLYDEVKDWAFPEPSMYRWDFDYNKDGWKKFLEIQGKNPDQTSDNYYRNYMSRYGPGLDRELKSH
jgi:hypothetical protein